MRLRLPNLCSDTITVVRLADYRVVVVQIHVGVPISSMPRYADKDTAPTVNRTPFGWVGSIPTRGTIFKLGVDIYNKYETTYCPP